MIKPDKIKEAGKNLKYLGISFYVFNILGVTTLLQLTGSDFSFKRLFFVGVLVIPIFMIGSCCYEAGKCLMKSAEE